VSEVISIRTPGQGGADLLDVPFVVIKQHLGMPAHAEVDAGLSSRVRDARQWCRRHARPWAVTVRFRGVRVRGDRVEVGDDHFVRSEFVARRFEGAGVDRIDLVAVSAGEEVDREIARCWESGRPDDAMCLNACAIATVEHLRRLEVDRAERDARDLGLRALPFYSPGFGGWDLRDQGRLFELVSGHALPGPLQLLDSMQLRPAKSTLAVIGIATRSDLGDLDGFWGDEGAARPHPLPERALRKWARDCLDLRPGAAGATVAQFRFRCTTCTGVPFAFSYRVDLETDASGAQRIAGMDCAPVEGDEAHEAMCAYRSRPDQFGRRLQAHGPYLHRRLEDALASRGHAAPSGCLCLRSHQNHKWQIVLQTIDYALRNEPTRSD